MADEVQMNAQADEVPIVDVADVPQDEKSPLVPAVAAKEPPPAPESDEESVKPNQAGRKEALETKTSDAVTNGDGDEKVPQSGSYKEESTRVADLVDNQKKAVEELKMLVREALDKHEFFGSAMPRQQQEPQDESVKEEPKSEEETKNQLPKEESIESVDTEEKAAASVGSASPEDDGAKTVEAIEDTVVSVSSSVQTEQSPEAAKEPVEANADPVPEEQKKDDAKKVLPQEISIWGVPLLADERSDVILLKFLRARDFKVKEAFTMLQNTIRWRKEFGIDELVEQDLGDNLEKVVFMHGFDKEGHPVCYNVFGEFQNKELYQRTFSDEDKRQNFLRWRIQFLEKSIRKLDFSPGGVCTIVQINDLKNSPGLTKWELRQATKQALQLLQDNYPEFVARQMFINVPWWYLAVNKMISPFLTQRTRSKFVFAAPSKSADTLFRYIAAEQVPVKYGGLGKDGEFANTDAVIEETVKPAAKHTVELPVTEACSVTWEVRVVGWDVSYGAEFMPSGEDSYTIIIQKSKKVLGCSVVCNNFKTGEPGKVVLTIHNPTSKKKKLLYRFKTMPTTSD
ncbi:Patellin-2 [Hibiscus syriacus]|uniref:Patellin-2 n=1 Tax=Hibiscus syriacus TaxID=106335 RepID=A0A6A2ZT83_HIBSY|nr:patellin-3-like [Hibiscus syriacus]KAE8694963.1 Patellin-2 [Hibiscus syriacus]